MIRVASIKKPDNTLLIKAFAAADVDDAQQAAVDWVSKHLERDDEMRIDFPEFFLLVAEFFVHHNAEKSDVPVVHSRIISDEDRAFLAGCLISFEDLRIPCCGQDQHPNVMPVDEAIKRLEDLRDKDKS